LFVLCLLVCGCSSANPQLNLESYITTYVALLNAVLDDPSVVKEYPDAGVCASSNKHLLDAGNSMSNCISNSFPGAIDQSVIDMLLTTPSFQVSVCDIPDPNNGHSGGFAFSSTGNDVSHLCPEGAVATVPASIAFTNTDSVYHVYSPASATYANDSVLAYATDADGPIVSAVANTALPPGVALNTSNGDLYVANRGLLVSNTYAINVTTTDDLGWDNSQIVYIVIGPSPASCPPTVQAPVSCDTGLCGATDSCCDDYIMGATCYDANNAACVGGTLGTRLCGTGDQVCGSACYSPSVDDCICPSNKLCPKGYLQCGEACYSPSSYGCSEGQLTPP